MTAILTLRRRFDAPPGRVYQASTDPAQFAQWIGPIGMPCTLLATDPAEGGALRPLVTGQFARRHDQDRAQPSRQ